MIIIIININNLNNNNNNNNFITVSSQQSGFSLVKTNIVKSD